MGFIKNQQIKVAMRLIAWQYEKNDLSLPETLELRKQAEQLVNDAGQIAKTRGRNVLAILKEMATEAMRR